MAQIPDTDVTTTSVGGSAYTVPFAYQNRAEVFVEVDGVSTTFTWINDGNISITPAPAAGAVVRRYRSTSALKIRHDYRNGVPFTPRNIAENNDQLLFVVQEAVNDTAGDAAEALAIAENANATAEEALGLVEGALVDSATFLRSDLADATSLANGATLVGYRGRTLRARLDEEVSIKCFGAVGDGVADDTAAVQAALDSGLPLFVPAGTYKLTATLTRGFSKLYMRGVGPASKFVHFGDYGDTLRITDPGGTKVVADVVLMDFLLHHDTSSPALSGTQLKLDAVRNFWLRGVHVRNGLRGLDIVGSDQGHIDGLYVLFDDANGGTVTGRVGVGVLPTANTGKGAHSGDVFFANINVRCGSTPYMDIGFQMTAGDGIWLCNSHVGSCTQAVISVDANNATKCTGLLVDNCWLDFGADSSGLVFRGSTPTLNGNHYIRNCKILADLG